MMDREAKNEVLWKIIDRLDGFIKSTNSKAAILSTFNVFVVSSILLGWNDLQSLFQKNGSETNECFIAALSFIAIGAALISLVSAFLAINPFLKSSAAPLKYHSALFFEHIAEHSSPEDYLMQIKELEDDSLTEDLSRQAHALAEGASSKFANLKRAVIAVIVSLVALFIMLIDKVIISL